MTASTCDPMFATLGNRAIALDTATFAGFAAVRSTVAPGWLGMSGWLGLVRRSHPFLAN